MAAAEPAEEAKAVAPKRGRRKKTSGDVADAPEAPSTEPPAAEAPTTEAAEEKTADEKPKAKRRSSKKAKAEVEPSTGPEPLPVPPANNDMADDDGEGPRRGWWQRTFG